MSSLAEVIINAGILDADSLQELRRWGFPVPENDVTQPTPSSNDLIMQIDQAVQEAGFVLTRETDLDAFRVFSKDIRRGTLKLEGKDGAWTTIEDAHYSVTPTGEYLFPWPTDDMSDVLTDGSSHLLTDRERVYFSDGRDLFFGEERAFLRMRVSTKESIDE